MRGSESAEPEPSPRTLPDCPHCQEIHRHSQHCSVVLVTEEMWLCMECGCEFEETGQDKKHPGSTTRVIAVLSSDAFYG
ncbi:MAG: hypothetical protein QGG53_45225 [Planctomycetota bacterium]|nr:hypothetical protein [Planctomycetota bacterium]